VTSDAVLLDAIDRALGWEPPEKIGVAVSGGSDSLAMLHLLHQWGRSPLVAATVDHGLRKEAKEEAAYVARVCEGLGIAHRTLRWTGWDGAGNLQAQAREARYGLLSRWAQGQGVSTVCLGHTRDDQAETFLMRLARRSGLDGLSAMDAKFRLGEQAFDRPILSLSRYELRSYLEHKSIKWVDDPSNTDLSFDRVKMRQALDVLAPLGIDAAGLSDVANTLKKSRDALRNLTYEAACSAAHQVGGSVTFTKSDLAPYPAEIRRRLIVAALCWVSSQGYGPRSDATEGLIAAIDRCQTRSLHGCLIESTSDQINVHREFQAVKDCKVGPRHTWDKRWLLEGPSEPSMTIAALGADGLSYAKAMTGAQKLPKSAHADPALWQGTHLIAAPTVGYGEKWKFTLNSSFQASIIGRHANLSH